MQYKDANGGKEKIKFFKAVLFHYCGAIGFKACYISAAKVGLIYLRYVVVLLKEKIKFTIAPAN
jgi:hypothetical protein